MSSNFGTPPPVPTGGSLSVAVTTSTTLSGQSYGRFFVATGAGGYLISLPGLSTSTPSSTASSIYVYNDCASAITVQATGSDYLRIVGVSVASLSIGPGDLAEFINYGSLWLVSSTTIKASLVGATFTGPVKGPTPTLSDNSTNFATTAFVNSLITSKGFATLQDPTFTGSPTSQTNPPQFDSTQRLMTTSAAKLASRQFGGVTVITTAATLDNSHFGKVVSYEGSGSVTVTMPSLTSAASGQMITIVNQSSNSASTLTVSGSMDFLGVTTSSYVLRKGAQLHLMNDRGTVWKAVGSGSYLNVIDANTGWAKFDSGLLQQWGRISITTSPTTANFNVSFPNVCTNIQVTDSGSGIRSTGASPTSLSQFSIWGGRIDNSGTAVYMSSDLRWFATGY